jgi:hypothetical protein
MANLADFSRTGDGTMRDPMKGAMWFERVDESGDRAGQDTLAASHELGDGVRASMSEVIR